MTFVMNKFDLIKVIQSEICAVVALIPKVNCPFWSTSMNQVSSKGGKEVLDSKETDNFSIVLKESLNIQFATALERCSLR